MKEFALICTYGGGDGGLGPKVARCAQDSASQALSRCFGLIRCEGPDRSELRTALLPVPVASWNDVLQCGALPPCFRNQTGAAWCETWLARKRAMSRTVRLVVRDVRAGVLEGDGFTASRKRPWSRPCGRVSRRP